MLWVLIFGMQKPVHIHLYIGSPHWGNIESSLSRAKCEPFQPLKSGIFQDSIVTMTRTIIIWINNCFLLDLFDQID